MLEKLPIVIRYDEAWNVISHRVVRHKGTSCCWQFLDLGSEGDTQSNLKGTRIHYLNQLPCRTNGPLILSEPHVVWYSGLAADPLMELMKLGLRSLHIASAFTFSAMEKLVHGITC